MWAITSYFNPAGYKRRLANFRTFRQKLMVPLVAVEVAYAAAFDLEPGDAEILIQLRGRDVMWQKERLLNIGLRAVPAECRQVAWLDCDIIFERDDWALAAVRLLDDFPLVQLFHEVYDLPREGLLDEPADDSRALASSFAFHLMTVGAAAEEAALFDPQRPGQRRRPNPGHAWAFRRDVFEKRGFYDVGVVGGGDEAILLAAVGKFEFAARALRMSARQVDHYQAWAMPFFDRVLGRTSYVNGRIFHLWHGSLAHRKYRDRHFKLEPHNFDPFADIALDDNGCWRWNSDKPNLHATVKDYLLARSEDG